MALGFRGFDADLFLWLSAVKRDSLYGEATWASPSAIKAAGLHKPGGLYFGETETGLPLHLSGDKPLITFGGSGSGKGRDVILHNLMTYPGHLFVNDPKGELAAVALHGHVRQDKHAYCINPFGLHIGQPWFLPRHKVNPLDVLRPGSPSLAADCKLIMEMMIPKDKGGDSYWSDKPREWGQVVLLWMVRRYGSVTLPEFYDLFSAVYADLNRWNDICAEMKSFPHPDVQRVIGEIISKREEAPKEFSGILGTLFNGLSFIGDEALRPCLDGGDFSLSVVTSDCQPVNVYLIFPAEYMRMYAPFLRLMIGVATIHKQRAASSPPVVFLIDEAAQLGYFEVLERGYSFGRGAGVRTWAFFQSMGQIDALYGREGGRSMVSSALLRQFFGVQDYDTARIVSEMCGQTTVFYDDPFVQLQHKAQGLAGLLNPQPSPALVLQAAQHLKMAQEQSIARRELIMPDEILRLPGDHQIAFIGDHALPPLNARKRPYFLREALAGLFLPNPFHGPYDRVSVLYRGKAVSCPVRTSPAPDHLAALPQYQAGHVSTIDLPMGSDPVRLPFWKRLLGF